MKQLFSIFKKDIKRFIFPFALLIVLITVFSGITMVSYSTRTPKRNTYDVYDPDRYEKAHLFLFRDEERTPFLHLSGNYVAAYYADKGIQVGESYHSNSRIIQVHAGKYSLFAENDQQPVWEEFDYRYHNRYSYAAGLEDLIPEWSDYQYPENTTAYVNIDGHVQEIEMNRGILFIDRKAYFSRYTVFATGVLYAGLPAEEVDNLKELAGLNPEWEDPFFSIFVLILKGQFEIGWMLYFLLVFVLFRLVFYPGNPGGAFLKIQPVPDSRIWIARILFCLFFPLALMAVYWGIVFIIYLVCSYAKINGDMEGVEVLARWGIEKINSGFFGYFDDSANSVVPVNIHFVFLLLAGGIFFAATSIKRHIVFIAASAGIFIGAYGINRLFQYSIRMEFMFEYGLWDTLWSLGGAEQTFVINTFSRDGVKVICSFLTSNHPGWWIAAGLLSAGCFFLGYRRYLEQEAAGS